MIEIWEIIKGWGSILLSNWWVIGGVCCLLHWTIWIEYFSFKFNRDNSSDDSALGGIFLIGLATVIIWPLAVGGYIALLTILILDIDPTLEKQRSLRKERYNLWFGWLFNHIEFLPVGLLLFMFLL